MFACREVAVGDGSNSCTGAAAAGGSGIQPIASHAETRLASWSLQGLSDSLLFLVKRLHDVFYLVVVQCHFRALEYLALFLLDMVLHEFLEHAHLGSPLILALGLL